MPTEHPPPREAVEAAVRRRFPNESDEGIRHFAGTVISKPDLHNRIISDARVFARYHADGLKKIADELEARGRDQTQQGDYGVGMESGYLNAADRLRDLAARHAPEAEGE